MRLSVTWVSRRRRCRSRSRVCRALPATSSVPRSRFSTSRARSSSRPSRRARSAAEETSMYGIVRRTSGRGAARTALLALAMAALACAGRARGSPAATPASVVPLVRGLTFTVTSHVGWQTNRGSVPVADTEIVYSVEAADASRVQLRFLLSARSGTAVGKLVEAAPASFVRIVRREDLQSATREKVLFGSDDPQLLPGQTYASTSAAVLAALAGTGKVAFVLGINEPEEGLQALSGMAGAMPSGGSGSGASPMVFSGIQMLLGGAARHYYRGALTR